MIEPFDVTDPERAMAVAYAPQAARAALSILFALDERLGGIVARTTEPAIGLMRLVWWRDALAALDVTPPPAEPLLVAASTLRGHGIDGTVLAEMTEGWEALLDDPVLEPATVDQHGALRGRALFEMAARLLDPGSAGDARIGAAGEAWARADLARHLTGDGRAAMVLESARPWVMQAAGGWRRSLRPLGMLAVLAAGDVRRGIGRLHPAASRPRLLRILGHQLTGR